MGELFRHDKEGSTLVRKGRREGGGAAAHCLGGRAGGGLTISVEPNEQEENWRRASRVSRSTRGVSGGAVGGLVRRKGRVWRAGLGLGRGSRRGGTTHESCDGGGSELVVDEETKGRDEVEGRGKGTRRDGEVGGRQWAGAAGRVGSTGGLDGPRGGSRNSRRRRVRAGTGKESEGRAGYQRERRRAGVWAWRAAEGAQEPRIPSIAGRGVAGGLRGRGRTLSGRASNCSLCRGAAQGRRARRRRRKRKGRGEMVVNRQEQQDGRTWSDGTAVGCCASRAGVVVLRPPHRHLRAKPRNPSLVPLGRPAKSKSGSRVDEV